MHCQFALIVTGHGERDCLPSFFRSLMERASCTFIVLRRIGQRSPVTSLKRLRVTGTQHVIPKTDEQEIGLPARRFLRNHPCHFVVLVDDIEGDRRGSVNAVFSRYRRALDTMLLPEEQTRAAVHFFANMLEAYYFADSDATNRALGRTELMSDHQGDVEVIGHPKNELKRIFPGFDERADAAKIVPALDLDHILSRPETCAFLRALVGWCVEKATANCDIYDVEMSSRYRLLDGRCAEPMRSQQAYD